MSFGNPYGSAITQVSLPFSNPIPAGLTHNKQIQIQGVVQNHPSANGFSVNLCEGPKIDPNCLLHFNPRFNENCIVRNAMASGSWGMEERDGGLPIVKGQPFEIIIMAAPSGYFVAVNGRHFTEFKHRMPMERVKFLHIVGDFLKINFIQYEGGNTPAPVPGAGGQPPAPGFHPGVAPPAYSAGGFVAPGAAAPAGMAYAPGKYGAPGNEIMYNPQVPLTLRVPGRMQPNRMIYISGMPRPDAKRFTVNLQSGPSGNINFHFDVRLNYGDSRNVVVRNTCINGSWGGEERAADRFPFSPNANFDMIILADATTFKVAVNNVHFISYTHRQPLEKSDTLQVTGDVRITTLRFQ